MSLFGFLGRPRSAPAARERLQLLLAHERSGGGGPGGLVAVLQREILAVIARHIPVADDMVSVRLDPGPQVTTLAIDIEVPQGALARG
jgi:cell division topological specificity factor